MGHVSQRHLTTAELNQPFVIGDDLVIVQLVNQLKVVIRRRIQRRPVYRSAIHGNRMHVVYIHARRDDDVDLPTKEKIQRFIQRYV
ncbi:hypothetical protein D3C76_1298640 [compost metagenome]